MEQEVAQCIITRQRDEFSVRTPNSIFYLKSLLSGVNLESLEQDLKRRLDNGFVHGLNEKDISFFLQNFCFFNNEKQFIGQMSLMQCTQFLSSNGLQIEQKLFEKYLMIASKKEKITEREIPNQSQLDKNGKLMLLNNQLPSMIKFQTKKINDSKRIIRIENDEQNPAHAVYYIVETKKSGFLTEQYTERIYIVPKPNFNIKYNSIENLIQMLKANDIETLSKKAIFSNKHKFSNLEERTLHEKSQNELEDLLKKLILQILKQTEQPQVEKIEKVEKKEESPYLSHFIEESDSPEKLLSGSKKTR